MNNSVRYVIGVDPSGSFHEGKGTTGLCVYDRQHATVVKLVCVYAKDYACIEDYFKANFTAIDMLCNEYTTTNKGDVIVPVISMEEYLLYAKKAEAQIHSHMETCQLIGYLRVMIRDRGYQLYTRPAVAAKKRWTDNILAHRGLIVFSKNTYRHSKWDGALPMHLRDAIRHAVHCAEFEVDKK